MPAQMLHVLYGEDLLRRTAEPRLAESVLGAYGVFFRFGCQGPDIFYHNRRTRPVSIEYGTLLHRRAFGDFAADLLRRTLQGRSLKTGMDALSAYALGFATHAFLDRAAHPYIVCKAGWVSLSKPETARYARCHAFFERILDLLMLERLRGADSAAWDQEALLTGMRAAERSALVETIAASLTAVFPQRAGKDESLLRRISNAFLDAESFYRVTNPARTSMNMRLPDGFEYFRSVGGRSSVALVYPERFSYEIDYLNLSRASWPHPCRADRIETSSFPELYARAVESGSAFFSILFSEFSRIGTIPAASASALGNGCLSAVGIDGLPCEPIHAEPLPLDRELDRQFRLRLKWIADRLPSIAEQE